MNKKIAFLLAVTLAMTSFPANVSAGSNNSLVSTPGILQLNTLLAERTSYFNPTQTTTQSGVLVGPTAKAHSTNGFSASAAYKAGNAIVMPATSDMTNSLQLKDLGLKPVLNNQNIMQVMPGSDLVIIPGGDVPAGASFTLTLNNAKWFFRDLDSGYSESYGSQSAPGHPYVIKTNSIDGVNVYTKYELTKTYDVTRGEFSSTATFGATDGTGGRYTRVGAGGKVGSLATVLPETNETTGVTYTNLTYSFNGYLYEEAAYVLDYKSNDQSVAYVTFPDGLKQGTIGNTLNQNSNDINIINPKAIVIPLVIKTTANSNVSVNINSYMANIQSQTFYLGSYSASSGLATARVSNPSTAITQFDNDKFTIEELKLGSLSNGKIILTAPNGFYFSNPGGGSAPSNISVYAGDGSTWYTQRNTTSLGIKGVYGEDYTVSYRLDSTPTSQSFNKSVLEITLSKLSRATTIFGKLSITGIKLFAAANDEVGDINVKVEGYEFYPFSTNVSETKMMDEQYVKFGTKVNYESAIITRGTETNLIK